MSNIQIARNFWSAEKSLTEVIYFKRSLNLTEVIVFDDISFIGEHCKGITVSGDYNCRTAEFGFNFRIKNVGAIRRFCIGGNSHGNAGRVHEHIPQTESDIGPENLPYAIPRPDLDSLSPLVVWSKICQEANIALIERFRDPEDWCK